MHCKQQHRHGSTVPVETMISHAIRPPSSASAAPPNPPSKMFCETDPFPIAGGESLRIDSGLWATATPSQTPMPTLRPVPTSPASDPPSDACPFALPTPLEGPTGHNIALLSGVLAVGVPFELVVFAPETVAGGAGYMALRQEAWDPWDAAVTSARPAASGGQCEGLDFAAAAPAGAFNATWARGSAVPLTLAAGGSYTLCVEAAPSHWESDTFVAGGPSGYRVTPSGDAAGQADVEVRGVELREDDRLSIGELPAPLGHGRRLQEEAVEGACPNGPIVTVQSLSRIDLDNCTSACKFSLLNFTLPANGLAVCYQHGGSWMKVPMSRRSIATVTPSPNATRTVPTPDISVPQNIFHGGFGGAAEADDGRRILWEIIVSTGTVLPCPCCCLLLALWWRRRPRIELELVGHNIWQKDLDFRNASLILDPSLPIKVLGEDEEDVLIDRSSSHGNESVSPVVSIVPSTLTASSADDPEPPKRERPDGAVVTLSSLSLTESVNPLDSPTSNSLTGPIAGPDRVARSVNPLDFPTSNSLKAPIAGPGRVARSGPCSPASAVIPVPFMRDLVSDAQAAPTSRSLDASRAVSQRFELANALTSHGDLRRRALDPSFA